MMTVACVWRCSYLARGGLLSAVVVLVALAGGGCLAPLAPLALQAGEMAGAGVISAASGKSHNEGTIDASESEERCDELALEVPGTIELQVADNSPTAWRE